MFPGCSTFFIFYGQNRPANGSPFGRAGERSETERAKPLTNKKDPAGYTTSKPIGKGSVSMRKSKALWGCVLAAALLLAACGKPNAGSSGSGSMSGSGAASQTTAAWKTGLGVVVETEDEDRTGSIRLHHMGCGGVDDGAFLPQEHHPVQTVGVAGAVDALDGLAFLLCGARQTLH